MKTHYIMALLSLGMLCACKKSDETKISTNKKEVKEVVIDESVTFMGNQISNMKYQIEAFKIGSERMNDQEVKKYLVDEISKIQVIQKEFESLYVEKGGIDTTMNEQFKDDLYKLSIADTKDFDNLFVLYYKQFLTKNIQELGKIELHNEKVNALKNKYGNELYDQKLYFDVKR